MTQVRVESFTISLDGYGAGPDQSVDNPLGVGGEALHNWIISTRSWQQMHGKEGGARYEHAGDGVMEATLDSGERRLPDWTGEADNYFASLEDDTELLAF